MPLPINIRSAIASDAHRLLAIRWDAIITLVDDFGHVAPALGELCKPRARHIGDRAQHCLGGGVRIDGCGLDRGQGCTKVNGLYVDSSVSRLGIGSSLMAYAELTIQTQGKVAVHLDASPNAVSFYARLGYEVAGAPKPDNSVPMVKRFGHDT